MMMEETHIGGTGTVGKLRLGIALWIIGLLGIASLLAAPLEVFQPPEIELPPLVFRTLAVVNPAIMMTLAVALGAWVAPRIGLDAPLVRLALQRSSGLGSLAWKQFVPAAIAALPVVAILYGYTVFSADFVAATDMSDVDFPLISRLGYGGIVEELMMRFGLMTLFVWIGWRLTGRPETIPAAVFVIGAAIAALLFAAGHLPLLFTIMPEPPASMIAGVMLGNAVPGILFGLLYWKRGIESAIMAHALAHLLFWMIGSGM